MGMQLEVEALGDEHAIVGFWDVEPGVNLVLFWNGVEDRGCCGERASVSYEDVFGDVVTECPFASDRVHVDSVARASVGEPGGEDTARVCEDVDLDRVGCGPAGDGHCSDLGCAVLSGNGDFDAVCGQRGLVAGQVGGGEGDAGVAGGDAADTGDFGVGGDRAHVLLGEFADAVADGGHACCGPSRVMVRLGCQMVGSRCVTKMRVPS